MHRTIYPILLLLAFIISIVFNPDINRNKFNLLYRILTIGFTILTLPYIIEIANNEANESMASGIINFNVLILPLKILLGLIGPFPWINFTFYETMPAYSYQLQDYFQGTFNIAFVICLFRSWKLFFQKNHLNLINLIGLFLIISGLFNPMMHMPYVAFGFMFLIPSFLKEINIIRFQRSFVYSFIGLIILNIIIIAFIGNMGISSLWK